MIPLRIEMVEVFAEIVEERDLLEKIEVEGRGDTLYLAAVGEGDGHGVGACCV